MSAPPFMQLYVGDYLADTLHLSAEEHGAYLLLLMTMWRSDGSLPDDHQKLARICRVSPKRWQTVWGAISEFFTVEDGRIKNARLTKERQKADQISQERSTAGKRGAEAKALKNKEMEQAIAADLPKHSQISDIRDKIVSSNEDTGDLAEAVAVYNDAAERSGWSKVQRMSKPRFSALRARISEAGGMDGWREAIRKAEESDFLCGRIRGSPFYASFDFLTQASSFTKLMEGNYDNRSGQARPDPSLRPIFTAASAFESSPVDWGKGRGAA